MLAFYVVFKLLIFYFVVKCFNDYELDFHLLAHYGFDENRNLLTRLKLAVGLGKTR